MLRKVVLFAAGVLVGIIVGAASTKLYLRHHILHNSLGAKAEKTGNLLPQMTMTEVEQLFGKPDHVDVVDGGIDGKYEKPKQIIWTYSRYKITDSDERYGEPGHVRFIPRRFMQRDWGEDDETARKYGEQSDTFRICSFRGSFPIRKEDWAKADFGLLDGYPLKELKK
jgi:hypothetical protein